MNGRPVALLLLLLPLSGATPALISDCGGVVSLSSLSVVPAAPQAGAPVNASGSGVAQGAIAGSGDGGSITAYLFGAEVFTAPVSACGTNQTIDVLGFATLTVNGLSCPVAAGAQAQVSLALLIPSIANGIGPVGVIANATTDASSSAWCMNLTVFF